MNNLQCRKAYVRVNLDVDEEGTIIPMVRVKITGEVTEVDREVMKALRAEEKRIRRALRSNEGSRAGLPRRTRRPRHRRNGGHRE